MARVLIIAVLLALSSIASSTERSSSTIYQFRKAHACPTTGKIQSTCKGWVINHIVPLCYGGEDSVDNMEWEEKEASYKRDAFERKLCINNKEKK